MHKTAVFTGYTATSKTAKIRRRYAPLNRLNVNVGYVCTAFNA